MPSESPKWIALVLSIFAITISGLGWWESHRNRLINEEINRPILKANGFYNSGLFSWSGDKIWISLDLKLKNEGKVTAVVNDVKVETGEVLGDKKGCRFTAESDIENPSFEVLPGAEITVHP